MRQGIFRRNDNGILTAAAVLVAVLAACSLFTGRYPLKLSALFGGDPLQRKVFFLLRAGRTVTSVLGGAVLGAAGYTYQTVFKNPLASPDVAGVSSGAGAGAAAGLLLFGRTGAVTASAFAGALAAAAAVTGITALDRERRSGTIVLAGIAVHSLAQTLLTLLKLTSDPERELASIEYWLMGSLIGVSSDSIGINMAICAAALAAMCLLHRQTLLLSLEDGEAEMLGVNVSRMRLITLLIATLAVSSVISLTGIISFVGLIAPHFARLLIRGNSRKTLFLSSLSGAAVLTGADILARCVTDAELPVSIFTSLIGAPLLIRLALKKRAGSDIR